MKKSWGAFLFRHGARSESAQEGAHLFEYAAQLIEVVDADTLKLSVDLGFKLWLRATFRLARINAPELWSFQGVAAKAFVVEQLTDLQAIKIQSSRSEKYGRWLCEFFFQKKSEPGKWHNLNNLLLEAGHAVKFKH